MEKAVSVPLGCPIPFFTNLVVRPCHITTPQEREEVLKRTENNPFAFPASMLLVDYLSDSGSTAMIDLQWAAMFRADESYGRNHGYYALQDTVRDTFERGDNQKRLINKVIIDEPNETWKPNYDADIEGGFVNQGQRQLERPNFFITPQGRCAENILYLTIRQILDKKNPGKQLKLTIPSNGWFDTTEAHARSNGIHPVNLFAPYFSEPFPIEEVGKSNPFKGNIDLVRLEELIVKEGPENIPFVLMTITNNTGAGQPVSMENIKAAHAIARKYDLPVWFDAARYAENAFFIHKYEKGYSEKSIAEITKEMFSYCDGFTMSCKKDGLSNMGGILSFRDKGKFWEKYSTPESDVGILMKEKQILLYGNDSYGGMSGRDIMALCVGLLQAQSLQYLETRLNQIQSLCVKLHAEHVPVVLPPGGHAAFIDVNEFFDITVPGIDSSARQEKAKKEGRKWLGRDIADFHGQGLVVELIRRFGIRGCELGAYAFEWDNKNEADRKGVVNLVRLAVPRNVLSEDHITFTAKAIGQMYKDRESVPRCRVVRGQHLRLRHFQCGLEAIYEEGKRLE
ncbi:tryptophanase [Blattamonas nauphoetae]|uniref:Tryptophanase n=1 Tax=Blattamonas nauphoetae TaxID=2049346 RepID=A0ABQ9XR40_9EUKA|nr:tryptophanase [Blattamonas nauphoetae]